MTLAEAARVLREGGVAAFPTETVYGLGANALDAKAVARIYELKGRPSTSPLIVHVASVEMARALVRTWPEAAERLAAKWWPGPLTLVLPKRARVPDVVTAGLDTAGIRMPAHPVALALLKEAGVPLAAPSANRFTQLSPTSAEHVKAAFGEAVPVLDGGPCEVGIESTVVSLAGERPVLLRPGMVSREELEEILGPIEDAAPAEGAHESPGLHERHYQPRTPLFVALTPPAEGKGRYLRVEDLSREPAGYARRLYAELHRLDTEGLDWIAVEPPPEGPAWEGIRDRLRRAGRYNMGERR